MQKPVVIVGGGLAGLTCARELIRADVPVMIVEASDRVGGRMKTDVVDGFRLDRGFQVYFSEYMHGRMKLDLDALDLKPFKKGSLVFREKLHEIEPAEGLRAKVRMLRMPLFGFKDKLKVREWNSEVNSMSLAQIRMMEDGSTADHLRDYGFSEEFMERFARPFLGGIFLDPELNVSVRQFAFVWKMLSEGQTTLPANGIEAIPQQVAEEIPRYLIRTHSRVREILREGDRVTGVQLDTTEKFEASAVVIATESDVAGQLTGIPTVAEYRSSTCLYFESARPCVDAPILVLNGSGKGVVNHVAPVSSVAPSYAPKGKHLTSVTVLGNPEADDESLAETVKTELNAWFPDRGTYMWRFIRAYRVRYAQMAQAPGFADQQPDEATETEGLFLAGETTTNSSIDGALESGAHCASKILARLRSLIPA